MDVTRVKELTQEVDDTIYDMFEHHSWDLNQQEAGRKVRECLLQAFRTIVVNVPPCPDRSAALRKLREARMDANSAITHQGKY